MSPLADGPKRRRGIRVSDADWARLLMVASYERFGYGGSAAAVIQHGIQLVLRRAQAMMAAYGEPPDLLGLEPKAGGEAERSGHSTEAAKEQEPP